MHLLKNNTSVPHFTKLMCPSKVVRQLIFPSAIFLSQQTKLKSFGEEGVKIMVNPLAS